MKDSTGNAVVMTAEPNVSPVVSPGAYKLLCDVLWMAALIAAIVTTFYFFGAAKVPSGSMYPTLKVGSKLLYIDASAEELDYDDIVLFYPEAELDKPIANGLESMYYTFVKKEIVFVKRIIGLPGDVLEIKDGYVYRNGKKLDPDYLAEPMDSSNKTYEVPEGSIFCMGDNRNHSHDSRYMGAIPCSNFFGKVIFYT